VTEYIDIDFGDSDDEDDDEDDEEDQSEDENEDKDQPSSSSSKKKFPISRAAHKLIGMWVVEERKRDQDFFQCHFYNDFSNYGDIESKENAIQIFLHELGKAKTDGKDFDARRLWCHVEALGMNLLNMPVYFCKVAAQVKWILLTT
jgi:hypothetical protein